MSTFTGSFHFNEKIKLDSKYEYLISQLKKVKGLHSLRHMYAIMWADHAATSNEISIDDLQSLCAFGLGHSSISSVTQYFTLRKKTQEKMIENINQTSENQISYIQKNLTYIQNKRIGQRRGR